MKWIFYLVFVIIKQPKFPFLQNYKQIYMKFQGRKIRKYLICSQIPYSFYTIDFLLKKYNKYMHKWRIKFKSNQLKLFIIWVTKVPVLLAKALIDLNVLCDDEGEFLWTVSTGHNSWIHSISIQLWSIFSSFELLTVIYVTFVLQ